jgi:hypothetical protein
MFTIKDGFTMKVEMVLGSKKFAFIELKLNTGFVINVEIPAPHKVTQFVVEILV